MSLWSPPTAPRPSGLSADCDREVQWVEIFHSRPSWRRAYLQARVGDGSTWSNPRDAPLVDAGHIRDGFRVYRAVLEPGQTIRFVITNGTARDWDGPPDGADSFTIDHGGRYVVQHGLRHVGEADELECATAVFYPNDKFVTVDFVAELWENCFCAYSVDGNDWTQPPGQQMQLVSTAPRKFSITIPAKTLMFAFNNGGDPAVWDSNHDKNFLIGQPGSYIVTEGKVRCVGRSQRDIDNDTAPSMMKPSTTSPKAPARAENVVSG